MKSPVKLRFLFYLVLINEGLLAIFPSRIVICICNSLICCSFVAHLIQYELLLYKYYYDR